MAKLDSETQTKKEKEEEFDLSEETNEMRGIPSTAVMDEEDLEED